MASGQYPEFGRRVRDAADQDADQRFAFGLACVLDGIAVHAAG
ncbi:TetR/AcrR family transcriptional regulator C-terminal domain-containing protein [Nocardia sp. NPDC051787]